LIFLENDLKESKEDDIKQDNKEKYKNRVIATDNFKIKMMDLAIKNTEVNNIDKFEFSEENQKNSKISNCDLIKNNEVIEMCIDSQILNSNKKEDISEQNLKITIHNDKDFYLDNSVKIDGNEQIIINNNQRNSFESRNNNLNKKSRISNIIESNNLNNNIKSNVNINIPRNLMEKLEKEGIISYENSPVNKEKLSNYNNNEVKTNELEHAKNLKDFKIIDEVNKADEHISIINDKTVIPENKYLPLQDENEYKNDNINKEINNNPSESIFIEVDEIPKIKNRKSIFRGDIFNLEEKSFKLNEDKTVLIFNND